MLENWITTHKNLGGPPIHTKPDKLKMGKGLHGRPEITKLLEENIEETLLDVDFSNDPMDLTLKSSTYKA